MRIHAACKEDPSLLEEKPELAEERKKTLEKKELLESAIGVVNNLTIIAYGGYIETMDKNVYPDTDLIPENNLKIKLP